MKFIYILIILCLFSCQEQADKTQNEGEDLSESGQTSITAVVDTNEEDSELEIYDFDGLKNFLEPEAGKLKVINFWATWCKPCIKELPHFERINSEYKQKNVEVLLVSLDFPNNYDSALKPYIKDNNLKSKVVALDDVDANAWIPKIDESWSGAIPATLFVGPDTNKFVEGSFTYEQLQYEINSILKL